MAFRFSSLAGRVETIEITPFRLTELGIGGAELDLLCFRKGKRLGFEFKYQDAPRLTRSMQSSMETLRLDSLTVIYPGKIRYPLANAIEVIPLREYIQLNWD